MQTFISELENSVQAQQLQQIYEMIQAEFPQLEYAVKWNQPMFLDHGTYIIGFSVSKHFVNVAPEIATMEHFSTEIKEKQYATTKNFLKIGVKDKVDLELIKRMIAFNIEEKKDYQKFWR
ncbi:DUF1801 domain-containing protein [Tuanshanicoccus lijuaniae]|uniref:iron chaperone n=1 Tax=Aerococcaceae bacterium zg-1292 TaxID=2774330 RepID=UPI00193809AB|nr:DUF1801 domain-containing protein [Aerococcaceae bacterium zg-1292]QQA36440.1 DUF1801 domain-containing protein [Aerococcaceae bacterium zg-1292]